MFKRKRTLNEVENSKQYADNPHKIKYLNQDEIQALLNVVKNESIRDYAIFMLSYNHGLRVSEVGKLYYTSSIEENRQSDYKEETRRITVHRAKGGLGYTYLISDEVYIALKKWLVIRGKEPGPLFPSRMSKSTGVGISKRQLDYLFKYYAKKAKIKEDKQHFHTLRHSIAVSMVDKDIEMARIQDWLGHRSIVSTMIYAKVSDKARNDTAEKLYGMGKYSDKPKGLEIDWKKDKKK